MMVAAIDDRYRCLYAMEPRRGRQPAEPGANDDDAGLWRLGCAGVRRVR
jgi:hypothetical protein